MRTHRLSVGHIIIIALLAIHLLPVWMFRYFPTQDGASHIYNSYVLKEYHKHENYRLREVYKLNPTLFPNWTSHVFLALLMYVFPPIICEKILLTLCIGLLPLSLFYFLNGVQKGKALFGLVGFIYAYNYLLHMGFYNFVLSISLFFFTLGYWWRRKDKLNTVSIGVIYVLLLGTYFTHYYSYSMLILSLTFFTIFLSLYEALQKTWGYKEISRDTGKTLTSSLKSFAVALKPALLFLGSMLPAYFIMLSYYLAKRGDGGNHRGFEWLKDYFFSMRSLVSFRDDHILIGRVLLVVFAIAFLLTVINRVRQVYRFRRSSASESDGPKERLWTKIITRKDQFLLMAVVSTVIYFRLSWSHYGGGWINDRAHLYIFLVLLPFFSVNLHRYINYAMAGIIIALSLWHLGYNVQTYYLLNRDIDNAISSAGMFEKHTILASRPGGWNGLSDSLGWKPKYVKPFGHLAGFLAVENGIAYLNNYEANNDYFPVRYRNRDLPADYVVIWRTEYDDADTDTFDIGGTQFKDWFTGMIDEVKLYNRGLTKAEVIESMQGTTSVKPIGYWNFDDIQGDVARDSSGNENHGTLVRGSEQVVGKFGQALIFDGTKQQKVEVPHSDSFATITGAVAIEAWISPANFNGWASFGVKGPGNYGMFINSAAMIRMHYSGGQLNTANNIIEANKWTHVVGTSDGNNVRIYINGEVQAETEDLQDDYDLIHSSNYNMLYRLKKAKPDENLWGGKTTVEFDMQSHNGQTAPDHIAIYDDTVYTDGLYGWLTQSDRDEFLSEADVPEPYKDNVWGVEDGVFRVALPNGEYEVTCYFCSGGSEPLEINLIANGEKEIKKLRLPTGNETIEKSYNVTITDERLTQVIYTRGRRPYKRWAWSGCAIKRTR